MKQTLNFLGPTKSSRRVLRENLSTPQHRIEGHQGKFQNQIVFYLHPVLGKNHSRISQ